MVGSSSIQRRISTLIGIVTLVAVVFTAYTAQQAIGSHQPANKGAAAGSDIDEVDQGAAGEDDLILSETMKVSSPQDLIIQVTSECSILTSLLTQGGPDVEQVSARSFGQVELYVTIDGKRVPVAADDTDGEVGEVVFCNRAYQRTITDDEDPSDGIDTERDFIATRTANAFNWLAIDTGTAYDSPDNGNNILTVQLWAQYERTNDPGTCPTEPGTEETCSEAFVGSRTMIIEPIKLSIHEQVTRDDPDGGI
jgi:hypothetical protein